MKTGWLVKPIGELCDIVGGGTPSKSNAGFFGGGIPWATVRDMKTDWIEATEHSITPAAVKSSATHILPAGTVVIASRVGLGKVCRVANDTAINQDLRGFIPKAKAQLDYQYLFWWFKSVADQIVAAGNGATVQGVTLPFLRSLAIPLPPLEEQRRIVAVLDKAFAGIATATANAQKNLTNARALFEGYLEATFTEHGEGWCDRRLGEICGLQNGFAFQSNTFQEQGIPVLRISNIQNEKIEARRLVYVNPDDYRENLDRFKVEKGALLIAMSGATTGKVGIFEENDIYYLNQRVGKFEPSAQLDKKFLFYYLITKVTENLSISAGSAQPNLSTAQIKDFIIPLPQIEEQERIVRRFVEMRDQCEQLKSNMEAKLAALAELKQSLLQKAFAGELT